MELRRLSELDDWKVADADLDIRGDRLLSPEGDELGRIRDLIVDLDGERVESVVLEDGRAFAVESLELQADEVITWEGATGIDPATRVGRAYELRMLPPPNYRH